jgi:hypothetical protein
MDVVGDDLGMGPGPSKEMAARPEAEEPLDRSSNKYSNLEFFRMILSHTKVEVIKAFMLPSINLKGQYCTGGCQTTMLFVF